MRKRTQHNRGHFFTLHPFPGTSMDIVLLIKAAVMGVVEGLTEFLPISSSGHLIVAEKLLGLLGYTQDGSSIAFYVMLHMGTLIAVMAIFFYFW